MTTPQNEMIENLYALALITYIEQLTKGEPDSILLENGDVLIERKNGHVQIQGKTKK